MSKYGGIVRGEPFDEEHWHNDPMDNLYNHDAFLVYMLRGSDQLHTWNQGDIGDHVLIWLIKMGLWNGTYPDNKYIFGVSPCYRHCHQVPTMDYAVGMSGRG